MSENVNLFPNPQFMPDGTRAITFADCTLDYRGDGTLGIYPVSGRGIGGYALFNAPVTSGDTYVFSFNMRCASGIYPVQDIRVGHMLSIKPATSMTDTRGRVNLVEFGAPNHEGAYTARFTVPTGVSFVSIYLRGSQSQNVEFSNPLLELASTYDAAAGTGGGQDPSAGGHSGDTPGTGTEGGQTLPAGGSQWRHTRSSSRRGGKTYPLVVTVETHPEQEPKGGQDPSAGGHSGDTPGTGTEGGQTLPAGGSQWRHTRSSSRRGGKTYPLVVTVETHPEQEPKGGQDPSAGGHSGDTPGTGTEGVDGNTTAHTNIYNLCSNPRIHAEHCKPTNCIIDMTTGNDALRVTATNNSSNAFVELPPIDVSKLNGVTLRCRVETTGSGTVSLPAICYMKFPDDGQLARPNGHLKGTSWKQTTIIWDFIVPNGEKTMIPVITAPADSNTPVHWARMLISTRADAQTLASVDKSQNLNYFDGSTRPE